MPEAPNTVLFLEGDHLQYDQWTKVLEGLPGVKFDRIGSESAFIRRIPDIVANPPRVVVAEVMLRWADPEEKDPMPITTEAAIDGFYWGGVRCLAHLAADPRTSSIPQILWSFVEREDLRVLPALLLPLKTIFIGKHEDHFPALRAQVTAYLNPPTQVLSE